jgi:hypothetical protein
MPFERIARLESEVSFLRAEIREANDKLDALLVLRNKGAGVLWLLSGIMGTGVMGAIITFLTYLRGH